MMRVRNYYKERQQRLRRYHRELKALLILLGGRCALCPCVDLDQLEFDHPNGRPYDLAKMSRLSRLRVYQKEADQKMVRLLCRSCNAQDGGRRRNGYYCEQ